MKQRQYIVVRYRGGWQYYAGYNAALGAPRWSDSSAEAERFADWDVAEEAAIKHRGLTKSVCE